MFDATLHDIGRQANRLSQLAHAAADDRLSDPSRIDRAWDDLAALFDRYREGHRTDDPS